MADPLTALMYAVQVMNFLKTLVLRTLRERKDSEVEPTPGFFLEPSDDNGDHSGLSGSCQQDADTENEEAGETFVSEEAVLECSPESLQNISSSEDLVSHEDLCCEFPSKGKVGKSKTCQTGSSNTKMGLTKNKGQQPVIHATMAVEKNGIGNLSRIDSRSEWIEAWR